MRPFERVDLLRDLAGLMMQQVDGVTRVVPQQVIGPAPRLALEIDVLAAEEERLHDEMLEPELAGLDPLVHPLVRRIEAARMTGHRDLAARLLRRGDLARVRQRVRDRNLDLDVLAGAQHLLRLRRVHLRRRGQDRGIDAGARERLAEVARVVRDPVLVRDRRGRLLIAADEARNLDVRNVLQTVQVLLAEGALANHHDLHGNRFV